MNTDCILEVKDVSKSFHGLAGASLTVLDKINIKIDKPSSGGIITSIVSPFNSGKTTLLKIISGIEKPSSGEVFIEGKIHNKADGTAAFVPEKPSSFPWMNVKQNIQFAIEVSKSPGKKEKANVDEMISAVGLAGYEDHFPHEKSAGFRLRISIARVLAAGTKLILLDDNFKILHGETKKEIIQLIKFLSREHGENFLFSTSNINDAVSISNKLFVMSNRPGKIIKIIDNDLSKLDESGYISSIKNEIENCFSGHDRIPSFAN